MKRSTPKLVILTLLLAFLAVSLNFLISKIGGSDNSGGVSAEEEAKTGGDNGGRQEKPPTNAEKPKNSYPLSSQITIYGRLQRIGSGGDDSALEAYSLNGYLYLIFYAPETGYDSQGAAGPSINIAKLDSYGNIIKAIPIKGGGASVYLASKPVWNGIAVALRSELLFIDYELNAVKAFPYASAADGASLYFSLPENKLKLYAVKAASMSVTEFDENLNSPKEKNMTLPAPCSVFSVLGGLSVTYIALNAQTSFYIYASNAASSSLERVAEGSGRLSLLVPHKNGYAAARESNGALLLYDLKFALLGERVTDGVITSLERTDFGFLLCSRKAASTELIFFCPHFDPLTKKTAEGLLDATSINGRLYLYSYAGFYFELYSLSDFEYNRVLTLAAENISATRSLSSARPAFIITASRLSDTYAYGGKDMFLLLADLK